MTLHLAQDQTWLDLLPLVLALFVMPLFSVYSGRQIAKNPQTSLVPRYLQTIFRGWMMAAIVGLIWWKAQRPAAALGLDIPVGRLGLYGLLFDAAVIVLLAIQFARFEKLVKPERAAKLRKQMTQMKILPRSTPELLVFILVSLTAGAWEELIYRGFLFWVLTPYVSLTGAIVISSLVFALGHAYQGFRGVVFSGILGFVFAIAFAFTHSLWWLIMAHALVDLNGGFVAWRVMRLPQSA